MSLLSGNGTTKADVLSAYSSATSDWLDLVSRLSVTGGYMTAMANTAGMFNLWFGYAVAGDKGAAAGSHNVGLGTYAAFKNRGSSNVWVGSRAGYENGGGCMNVGVGWGAGGACSSSEGGTSVGYRAGESAGGSGNVSVGDRANALPSEFLTPGNVAVGACASAHGGGSVAIGAGASAGGAGAAAVGRGASAGGAGSVAIGDGVASGGERSLHVMPTRGAGGFESQADGELNVYGVLTGAEEAGVGFRTRLTGDAVSLSAGQCGIELSGGAARLSAAGGVAVASPVAFSDLASFSGRAAFAEAATFAGRSTFGGDCSFAGRSTFGGDAAFAGAVTLSGRAVFECPAVFRGGVDMGDAGISGRSVSASEADIGSLRVSGNVSLPPGAIPSPEFVSQTTSGGALFLGQAVFKGGVHACCGPVEAGQVIAHEGRFAHLTIEGGMAVEGGVVSVDKVAVRDLEAATVAACNANLSALSVSGDLMGTGNLYYAHAYIGDIMASSINTSGPISASAINTKNIVCDTITVTGMQTLKVLGSSVLNSTVTKVLKVEQETDLDRVTVSRDVYVGTHTDTGTLTVRDGTVMQMLTANFLAAAAASLCNVTFDAAAGGTADIGAASVARLDAMEAAISSLASSNVTGGFISADAASICNLTVGKITMADGIDASSLKLHDATLTGLTSVQELTGSGNAHFGSDVVVDGTLRAGVLEVTGGLSLSTGLPVVFDDVAVFNSTAAFRKGVSMQTLAVEKDLSAGTVSARSVKSAGDVVVGGCLKWKSPLDTVSPHHWEACLQLQDDGRADLRFRSVNGTLFVLTDEFEPGVLNFTGKHRCVSLPPPDGVACEPGMVFVACGGYDNLDGSDRPTIDESIPVVRVSTEAEDPRAFGVLASTEDAVDGREYRIGTISIRTPPDRSGRRDARVVLNSVGEGGVWVVDEAGEVSPGDLLVTSSFAGHAMRQRDDAVRACTIGKVSGGVGPGGWEPLADNAGRTCRRAFVGVTYKF